MLSPLAYTLLRNRIARGRWKNPLRNYLAKKGYTVDVQTDGIIMRCHFGDNRTEQLLAEGRHDERDNLKRVTKLLPKGGTFVDIGANCGLFTLYAAKAIGSKGTVLAIEPLPQLANRITTNVELNAVTNIHLVQGGVGPKKDTLTLYAVPYQLGQSSMVRTPGAKAVKVPVQPLTTILKASAITSIDVLKIDIEGYEDQALLPFFKTAPKSLWPKHIFMEVEHRNHWQTDCIATLAKLGYKKAWNNKNDMLLTLTR